MPFAYFSIDSNKKKSAKYFQDVKIKNYLQSSVYV